MHRSFHIPAQLAFFALLISCPHWTSAQGVLDFNPNIPVMYNGAPLTLAWGGGLNAPQVSPIDFNQDGLQDIFLFDRSGNKPVFLLNIGTASQAAYVPTHDYDNIYPFPLLHDWALLRDYNCDGKVDIFAYVGGGFAVYRNTSDASGLSFTLVDDLVGSNYVPTISPNLFITELDIPGIVDMDGDGDLDVLTFSIFSTNYLEFHKNLSMELYGTCDSLAFEVRSRCWGEFQESISSNSIALNISCTDNVPNPEVMVHGAEGIDLPASSADRAHSGSTLLPLDLDGDGDMDLILGDYQSPDLTALTNGGTLAHAHMVAMDTLFPIYDQRVYFDQFLSPFFLDIDGDGKRDLVVTTNSASAAENKHGVWYYRNTGSDAAPVFHFQQDDLFQGQMLDFGEGARPVLFDYNGDGLMDLVVANEGYYQTGANYLGRLALLANTGTATQPSFNLVTTDYAQLGGLGLGSGIHPAFGDVDGDGHPDMILGDAAGALHFFHNTSSGPIAQFQLTQAFITDDNGTVIDVGTNATPQLFDLDGDGRLDLIVGERNGNLNYYKNTGTAQTAVWHLATQTLGGVHVNEYWSSTGYSVPFLYRDEEGQLVCLSGSEVGGIHRYDGITGDGMGTWNLTDSVWNGYQEGIRTGVTLYDFTGDGQLDAVLGNYRGGLSFWSSGTITSVNSPSTATLLAPFSLAPNPANTSVDILWNAPMLAGLRADLIDDLGRIVRTITLARPQSHMELSELSPGLYTMRLTDGQAQWTRRLAVLR